MGRNLQTLLKVWREAARYTPVADATARIAAVLQEGIPLTRVVVQRLDVPHRALQTVAVAPEPVGGGSTLARTPLDGDQLQRAVACCQESTDVTDQAEFAAWPEPGARMIGSLRGDEGPLGFVTLVAGAGPAYTAEHRRMLLELLPPFALVLDNDQRIHALRSDREAAEADREALLRRLGRESLQDAIIGAQSGLRTVMERVDQVARADVPVLIFGETGSGKEVIARAIHDGSERRLSPFLRVNCGAIPPELVDSELFGHERGSFTGAIAARQGWFERADGGTLFLDEIGELPGAAQVRLLRVLQDGTFERVGGQRQLKVDVRIVGATHRDLHGMVAERRFREDLWYRISVFPIYLPPLRERLEDLPALALHFAQRAARRFGLPLQVPTLADIDLMSRYPWPGNIRELAAVIDRAAILGNGERLAVSQALGANAQPPLPAGSAPAAPAQSTGGAAAPAGTIHRTTLNDAMRACIESALRTTRGRIDGPHGVARMLEVNPHTLRARMRKLGIDWRRFRAGASDAP